MKPAIQLWEFDDAPEGLQSLSQHGGDEDGVVLVPPGVEPPFWLERLWSCYSDPTPVVLPDGSRVYIWAHA